MTNQELLKLLQREQVQTNSTGVWSLIALIGALAIACFNFNAFATITDLPALFTGNFNHSEPFPTLLATIFSDVVCSLACIPVVIAISGSHMGKHGVRDMMNKMEMGNNFMLFFLMVVLEELFARWLFLGVLRDFAGHTTFNTIVLFLLGNGVWAVKHLSNFKEDHDKALIRVLPQFVGGVFFSYIYLKYGLLLAVVAHMGSNAVVFATHKVENDETKNILLGIYCAVVLVVAQNYMQHPLSELAPWITAPSEASNPTLIEGWQFWDYFKAMLTVNYGLALVACVLMLDNTTKKDTTENPPPLVMIGIMAALVAVALWLQYFVYWLTGFFSDNFLYRALATACLFSFLAKGRSGSDMCRTFFVTIPTTYFGVCLYQAFDFWSAAGLITLNILVSIPAHVIGQAFAEVE